MPENTRRLPTVGLMLGQRLRRWPNIKYTSGKRLVVVWIYQIAEHDNLNTRWFLFRFYGNLALNSAKDLAGPPHTPRPLPLRAG